MIPLTRIDLPWTQQPDPYTCAPATVRMILRAYGIDVSVDALKPAVGWSRQRGADRYGVADALNSHQRAHFYRVSNSGDATANRETELHARKKLRASARQDLPADHPIALAVNGTLPGYPGPVGHWVVVAGIDGDRVLIADPTAGRAGFEDVDAVRWINLDRIPIKAFVA